MLRVPVRYLILLFAAFAALNFLASPAPITESEARLLWIVRDPEKIQPAAVGDTVRLIGRNVRAMLDRAEFVHLPLAVPLDAWTMLAGGSVFAARLPLVFLVCVFFAIGIRLQKQQKLLLIRLYIFMFVFLCVVVAPIIIWFGSSATSGMELYLSERTPDEAVITLFREDSIAGYYQAQVDFRRGIGIDLGWREFSEAEMKKIVANLTTGTIWVIGTDTTFENVLWASGWKAIWQVGTGSTIYKSQIAFALYKKR